MDPGMKPSFAGARRWAGVHLFRLWTALAVVGSYGYLWVNKPEYLTWWKRTTDAVIEGGCGALPYPWGDRIESTIGDFGVWVQLTLAILTFRVSLSLLMMIIRSTRRRRR
jgi:hypothetical protein